MKEDKKKSLQDFSTVQSTIEYFKSKGATQGQKTGSILMPLSKKQREAMENEKTDKKK